jgi:N-terminal acetyltransferase B complex catalytic subunit
MAFLEEASTKQYNAYFVDLFVRVSNKLAQLMYRNLGYIVYRQVLGYYSGEEDAYDMRKALPRDPEGRSVIPLTHPVTPDQLEW